MSDTVLVAIIASITSMAASTGFWTWVMKRDSRQTATNKLLLGLAHDRIVFLSMSYISRGWITKDEYEDYFKYLYTPYSEFGGNGLAEKLMQDVTKLPMVGNRIDAQHFMKEKHDHNSDEVPPVQRQDV